MLLYNLEVMYSSDPVSRSFAALADPTRRAIVERLLEGEAGVVELSHLSLLTQPAITKHLKVLESAGLITRRRDGQRRPARLNWDGLSSVEQWMNRAHAEWDERLARLEAHLESTTTSPLKKETPDD